MQAWPEAVRKYKGGDRYVDVLLPYLDKAHAEQLERGDIKLNEDDEVVGALRYPY